jgi:hypothetical protein
VAVTVRVYVEGKLLAEGDLPGPLVALRRAEPAKTGMRSTQVQTYADLTNAERARAWAAVPAEDPEGMPPGFREWAAANPVGRPRPTLEETPYTIANLLARRARAEGGRT